jgi:hypothetical protein
LSVSSRRASNPRWQLAPCPLLPPPFLLEAHLPPLIQVPPPPRFLDARGGCRFREFGWRIGWPGIIGDPARAQEGQDEAEGTGDEEEDEEYEDEDDSLGGPQAFSIAWYEARRGQLIPPRFDIPQCFDLQYSFAFQAESVATFRTFGSGNASFGWEAEATALFSSSVYLTEI